MSTTDSNLESRDARSRRRLRTRVRGAVQGVGFRPFIFRLASDLGLAGWVVNSAEGVLIEVEGEEGKLQNFLARLRTDKPPLANIHNLDHSVLEPANYRGFTIQKSITGDVSAWIMPDLATCSECLRELFDPVDRRYLYPFTNCTACGPRFSIVESLPYERPRTSMKGFIMCQRCRAEYENPADRRFHAEPNGCPECGPRLQYWTDRGECVAQYQAALAEAVGAIEKGNIVAVKGVGGFHLMVDALNDEAVKRLRERKRRTDKPLALMYPTLEMIRCDCEVSDLEEQLLRSPEAPIVLLRRRRAVLDRSAVSASVAPGNPYLGIMLPYAPLYHLMMRQLSRPIVATSGNLSEEPICIDEQEALKRLAGIADYFLVHNRPILRHLDDSIVRVMAEREITLRRGRGYAPLPISMNEAAPNLLAVGGHLKNTIAVFKGAEIYLSQHIGDLDSPRAYDAFLRETSDFERLYECASDVVVCDLHPDYRSTQFARRSRRKVIAVQHHQAHVLSCMADNELEGPLLGVAWDGLGFGLDGKMWGGEFFHVERNAIARCATFRPLALLGGERAIREPARTALAMLYETFGDAAFGMGEVGALRRFTVTERESFKTMLASGFCAPKSSSVGRLFDGAAALLGLCLRSSFEGQAAMALEFALAENKTDGAYALEFSPDEAGLPIVIDWRPMIRALLDDIGIGAEGSEISAKFHNTLVEAIVAVAMKIAEERVVLSGGCFQNCYLTERAITRLRQAGFQPYWHRRIPPNDGGIAVGQMMAAGRRLRKG